MLTRIIAISKEGIVLGKSNRYYNNCMFQSFVYHQGLIRLLYVSVTIDKKTIAWYRDCFSVRVTNMRIITVKKYTDSKQLNNYNL